MQQIDCLYKKEGKKNNNIPTSTQVYSFVPFSRRYWRGKLPAEHINFKILLSRLWFKLISMGKLTIYYTTDTNGVVTHTSYVVGKCFKFPFLNVDDYEIGPCVTHPDYRGQGLFPMVLEYVTNTLGGRNFYMLVDPHNIASVRGIEKAGFSRIGETQKTKFKRYVTIK